MTRPPPWPGSEPWLPSPWTAFVLPLIGAAIAHSCGWRFAYGSLAGSLVCIAYSFVWRWRWKRWLVRSRAFVEWCIAETEAGRPLPPNIKLHQRREV